MHNPICLINGSTIETQNRLSLGGSAPTVHSGALERLQVPVEFIPIERGHYNWNPNPGPDGI